jgi:hypothetical protein
VEDNNSRSNFLIPANTKSGALILNIFRPFDVILLLSGVGVTLILLFILPIDTLPMTIIALAPALVCSFLVLPIPNYHNVLTVIISAIDFFTDRRVFIWKGWCVYERQENKK